MKKHARVITFVSSCLLVLFGSILLWAAIVIDSASNQGLVLLLMFVVVYNFVKVIRAIERYLKEKNRDL